MVLVLFYVAAIEIVYVYDCFEDYLLVIQLGIINTLF